METTATLNVTDPASKKIAELLTSEPEGFRLRVAVRPGGCSGFSYEMYFDKDCDQEDMVQDINGVPIVVDPASSQLLADATLDYKDGLQAGFHITNPNAQRTCGCGQSFS